MKALELAALLPVVGTAYLALAVLIGRWLKASRKRAQREIVGKAFDR